MHKAGEQLLRFISLYLRKARRIVYVPLATDIIMTCLVIVQFSLSLLMFWLFYSLESLMFMQSFTNINRNKSLHSYLSRDV